MQLLPFKEVRQMTGLSRSTIFRYEKAGNFPRRKILSARAVRWEKSEIESWMNSIEVAK